MEGVHYLSETIMIDSSLSNLNIFGANENAWISGGRVIETDWQPYNVSKGGPNIYVTYISDQKISEVLGLNTVTPYTRKFRARYPNSNPEKDSPPKYLAAYTAIWTKRKKIPKAD